jgi:hypothetical protein
LLCPAKGLHCSSVKFIMHISSNTSILITNINCMIKHRVMFKHQHFCGLLFSLWSGITVTERLCCHNKTKAR